ncbi:MAG: hypothetical protein U1F08_02490 [Steroidobacteraceae bacterium]
MSTTATTVDWQALDRMRVVFGHQSVGGNILEGVSTLAKRDGRTYGVVEARTPPSAPGITHFKIGTNGDPSSKIRDFAAALDSGVVQGADVALMKLCYIDFDSSVDPVAIAREYADALDGLAARHPTTKFVAVTAPLTTVQTGPKAWVKRLLGRQPGGYAENARRASFNKALRERYASSGRLFDLARYESTAGGHDVAVIVDGATIEALDPSLSDDGGHLNAAGQQLIARQFLEFLAATGRN